MYYFWSDGQIKSSVHMRTCTGQARVNMIDRSMVANEWTMECQVTRRGVFQHDYPAPPPPVLLVVIVQLSPLFPPVQPSSPVSACVDVRPRCPRSNLSAGRVKKKNTANGATSNPVF